MAVTRALSRLAAGAEVALAVSVLAACGGSSPATQPAGVSPTAEAQTQAPGSTPGTGPAPAGQPAPAGGPPRPAATRASLFDAFNAVGAGGDINLRGVPDGASCTVAAHRQGRSEQLAIAEDQPQVAGQDALQFTLVDTPDGATIVWSATCTLRGETKTITAQTTTEPSGTTTAPPSTAPARTGTPTPAGPTPSASHS
jgi:hypothetical protein